MISRREFFKALIAGTAFYPFRNAFASISNPPSSNELLISQGSNVSRNTLHLQGLAIDFSIEGVSNKGLSRIAKSFSAGGVGKYPEFVHIDVGRVRYW